MKSHRFAVVLCVVAGLALAGEVEVRPEADPGSVAAPLFIPLDDPGAIADAEAVKRAMDAVGRAVGPCVRGGGGAPRECFCNARRELDEVRGQLDTAFRKHPEWRGRGVAWAAREDDSTRMLSFRAVETQLLAPCRAN